VTGYLVDEGDTVTMAEHIGQLAASPDLRASMGAAGWARARERYTWDRERAELLRIMGLDG
jgi:glycosyltransferase involved in cell wall biosynthesis